MPGWHSARSARGAEAAIARLELDRAALESPAALKERTRARDGCSMRISAQW